VIRSDSVRCAEPPRAGCLDATDRVQPSQRAYPCQQAPPRGEWPRPPPRWRRRRLRRSRISDRNASWIFLARRVGEPSIEGTFDRPEKLAATSSASSYHRVYDPVVPSSVHPAQSARRNFRRHRPMTHTRPRNPFAA
jgi:hypothetical protein